MKTLNSIEVRYLAGNILFFLSASSFLLSSLLNTSVSMEVLDIGSFDRAERDELIHSPHYFDVAI